MQFLDQSLGHIATEVAGATAVFHQYGLDFCCGGDRSLREALERKSVNADPVLAQLQALLNDGSEHKDWRTASNKELVEHILVRYHERHREQLTELIRLARRVEHVHSDHPECPLGLAEHLFETFHELESHMAKEEQILFPMLVGDTYPDGPIMVMEEEHVQHGEALAKIDELTNGIRLPHGACNTWTALYIGLQEFKRDVMDHIHLENQVLFKPQEVHDGHCCGGCQ
ncbi:iron-sulfur cluster repair protein YtfE [Aliidiomarina sp. Khilg15.8]